MAEDQYRRLSCGACLSSFTVPAGKRGRRPDKCDSCRPTRPVAEQKQCPACRGTFVSARQSQVCCSKKCGGLQKMRRRRGTIAPTQRNCKGCGVSYMPRQDRGVYCSQKCKKQDWWRLNPDKAAYQPSPPFSTYVARYCDRCGKPSGKRSGWATCTDCIRQQQAVRAREANRASSEAIHRAAAKEVSCNECGARYCPLYGGMNWRGNSRISLCQVCRPVRRRQHEKAAKAARAARKRGASKSESVSPRKVFDRDEWRCYLCGRDTPRELRGSTDGRAPELEHVVPLARGGEHTMANARCACRRCNSIKADHPLPKALRLIGEALYATADA